jgi:tRNA dimethylallyltransferase
LVIFAPTACGKTDLLFSLFSSCALSPFAGQAEIISADSVQVYRGLNTGSAKPGPEVFSKLPHHLIDLYEPSEQFTVGDFVRQADERVQEISRRGKLPVVAGGAGFYIRHFLCGLPSTPEASGETRALLQTRLQTEGAGALYQELAVRDPVSAAKIHINDGYRILRALEVCIDGGKPLSAYPVEATLRKAYRFCVLILYRDREELYRRIDRRTELMFHSGLEEEVRRLAEQGYTEHDPGMRAIGYREFFCPHIRQIADLKERRAACLAEIQRNTRRYAKRQETFMKGIFGARMFHADDTAGIASQIAEFCRAM